MKCLVFGNLIGQVSRTGAAVIVRQGGCMGIATVNPTTGEVVKSFEAIADIDLECKVAIAQAAFLHYRQTSFEQLSQWLQ